MKSTLDIPDQLFRRTKAEAALRGQTLSELVGLALEAYLESRPVGPPRPGWRAVFGKARPEEVREIDAVVAEEFERMAADDRP